MKEEDILNHIKELCLERNWTIYQLCKNSDIPLSTMNNLIKRNNTPSLSTLIKICEGLSISLSDFFSENTLTTKELTPKQLELVERWNSLSPKDRELLNAYLTGLEKKIL